MVPYDSIPFIHQISVLVNNDTVVGKEGVLDIVTDPEQFPSRVSTYFQRLPPQVDKEARVVAPVLDSKLGTTILNLYPPSKWLWYV